MTEDEIESYKTYEQKNRKHKVIEIQQRLASIFSRMQIKMDEVLLKALYDSEFRADQGLDVYNIMKALTSDGRYAFGRLTQDGEDNTFTFGDPYKPEYWNKYTYGKITDFTYVTYLMFTIEQIERDFVFYNHISKMDFYKVTKFNEYESVVSFNVRNQFINKD